MAQPPMMASPPAAGADPAMGAAGAAPPPGGDADGDMGSDEQVVVTITKVSDGTYTVYAGDEPDDDMGGDMSEEDADAMGSAPPPAAGDSGGQHADSIGQALKITMEMLNADKSSAGGEGSAEDQFASGFSGAPAGP